VWKVRAYSVCGEVTLASQRRSITPLIKKAYHLYFGCKLGDQDMKGVLHIVCKSWAILLGGWINHKGMAMLLAFPMVWREPSNHSSDCYFCMTPPVTSGMKRKKKQWINYPNIHSARAGATKRIQFEFECGRGRHGENRTSRRRTYRSILPRSSIWITSQTYTKLTEWSSMWLGAAKVKGRSASIQNETMDIFGLKCENNSVSL